MPEFLAKLSILLHADDPRSHIMKVQSILQSKGTDVFCVAKSDKISDAVTLLTLKRIGLVAGTDQAGALCGILSERDIVRRMGQGEKSVQSLSVESCMTPDP